LRNRQSKPQNVQKVDLAATETAPTILLEEAASVFFRGIGHRMLSVVLTPLSWFVHRAMVRSGPRVDHKGVTLAVGYKEEHADAFFSKCGAALNLIESVDPRRFNRLRRDLAVLFLSGGGGPYYEEAINAFIVDLTTFRAVSVERLASMIVHEATHARIRHAGNRTYARHKERHERICVRAEIDFVKRLPASSQLLKETERRLEDVWWSEEDRRSRIRRFVDGYQLPNWVARVLVTVGKRWG
jgi:hypothetical protein